MKNDSSPSDKTQNKSRLEASLLFALMAMMIVYGFLILSMVVNRLTEVAIVDSDESVHSIFAWQVSQGMPLYGPRDDPQVQDLFSYTPFSFQIMGNLARLVQPNVRIFRLTTLLFSLAAALMLGLIAHRLSGSKLLAALASILFLAYPFPAWYITIGPNPFLAFFGFMVLWLLLRDEQVTPKTTIVAAVFACMAFWTKQTGLIYIASLLFYLAVINWRRTLLAGGIITLLSMPAVLYFSSPVDSSFVYNVFMLQKQQPMNWNAFPFPALYPELLGRFGILLALILWCLLREKSIFSLLRKPEWIFLGAAMVVGFVARLKYGSGITQGLMMGGLMMAVGFGTAWKHFGESPQGRLLVLALALAQGLCFIQPYAPFHITPEDHARYNQLMEIVRSPGKNVYYNNHSFYQVLTGKPVSTTVGRDCYWQGRMDKSRYPKKLREFYDRDPFDVIIIDVPLEDNSWPLYDRLQKGAYQQVGEIPATARNADAMTLRFKKMIFAKKELGGKNSPQPAPVARMPRIMP